MNVSSFLKCESLGNLAWLIFPTFKKCIHNNRVRILLCHMYNKQVLARAGATNSKKIPKLPSTNSHYWDFTFYFIFYIHSSFLQYKEQNQNSTVVLPRLMWRTKSVSNREDVSKCSIWWPLYYNFITCSLFLCQSHFFLWCCFG